MLASPRLAPALAARLERLNGPSASCCAEDLHDLVGHVRGHPAYRRALVWSRALGDENRLLAASLLGASGGLCACELQAALGVTHATVSHHMERLRDAGLVLGERRGKWMHYRLTPEGEEHVP